MGVAVVGSDSMSERAAMMRESLQKSQTITDNVVTILGSFDHRLSALETAMRPTQIRTHSIRKAHENIDRTLKAAEVILAKFDLSRQAETKILRGPHEDLESYLGAIDQLKGNIQFFSSKKSFRSCDAVISNSNNLLTKAISKLEDEFKQRLLSYSKPVEPDRLFDCLPNSLRPSSGSPGPNGESSGRNPSNNHSEQKSISENAVYTPPTLIPPRILPLLHDLAQQMVQAGHQQQLLKIYRDTRSSVLEESLRKLGVEKLSKEDVQKMQWEVLEAKIGNWIHFMRIAVKLLYAGERMKVLSDYEQSILFSNRAHVNLLLGNYRRALMDAEEAIKLCPTNVKALYRAAKASLSLNLLVEVKSFCEKGLEHDPNNKELKKLAEEIDLRRLEHEQREAQVSRAVAGAKDLVSAIEDRGSKIGKAMFQELTGLRKPTLDNNNILHWPVLLLYAEVMSSDFIEDFCETDMFSAHLDMMFSDTCPPLPWDKENNYTRESIELYYEAGSGVCLSKSKLLHYLLEGTAASHVESIDVDEKDTTEGLNHGISSGEGSKWVKVGEKRTLHDVLKEPNFIIPGIPVFYVVSKRSSFYKEFKAGKWVPPP